MSGEKGWFAELSFDLGMSPAQLTEELREYIQGAPGVDAFQKKAFPREDTVINYKNSTKSRPPKQTIGLILSFLSRHPKGALTRYAEWARAELPEISKTTQLNLTHRLEIEQIKRRKSLSEHMAHVRNKYVGVYYICRVNSSNIALREYFIIRESNREMDDWYPKLQGIWINYKKVYTGDVIVFPTTFTAIMLPDKLSDLLHSMNFTITRDRRASTFYNGTPLTLAATYSGESQNRSGIYTARCAFIRTEWPNSLPADADERQLGLFQQQCASGEAFAWPADYLTQLRNGLLDVPGHLFSAHEVSRLAHGSSATE